MSPNQLSDVISDAIFRASGETCDPDLAVSALVTELARFLSFTDSASTDDKLADAVEGIKAEVLAKVPHYRRINSEPLSNEARNSFLGERITERLAAKQVRRIKPRRPLAADQPF